MVSCRNCNMKLAQIDLYCLGCGIPTESYKQEFKLINIFKQASENSKQQDMGYNFFYIAISLILITIFYVTHFKVIHDAELFNYIFLNVSVIIIAPLLFLPFATITDTKKEKHSNKEIASKQIKFSESFKFYPQLVFFTLILSLYFALVKVICQGEPILNIVRVILILWGLAIALPVPFLIFNSSSSFDDNVTNIEKKERINIITLYEKAYIAGKYLRWHQFAICLILGILNLASIFLLLIPLPAAMNFTGNVMYIWHKKQNNFLLYSQKKDY